MTSTTKVLFLILLGSLLIGCIQLSSPAPTSIPPTATPAALPRDTAMPITIVATPTPLGEALMEPIDIEEQLITNLYERVGPSVVHITARIVTMSFFYGPLPSEGTGSGFVFDEQGHIVTNYHVIERAESLEVRFSDELSFPANVIGTDPGNDLAVLELETVPANIVPLELGSSTDLRVGQRAIAIGNPFGLDQTLTTGVISALGRPLQTDNDNVIFNVIQTDAAINPGNSGGPLLNSRGQVVGINTAIRQNAEGIGFAVPVDTLKRVLPALIEEGFYPHPWLGLLGYSITPSLADALKLSVESGVLVAQLYRRGPAAAAGIQGAQQEVIVGNRRLLVGGDIITAIDDHPVKDWDSLSQYLELNTVVGETVRISVLREGEPMELSLELEAQP